MDVLNGSVLTVDGIIDGYVCIENGKVAAVEEGKPPEKPLASGMVIPPMVNAHTHCADAGLKVPPGMAVEDLVAPPNGLKHVYLKGLDDRALEKNITEYARSSFSNGIGAFIDFREGGEKGCRVLRKAVREAVIMGRPLSEEYDEHEISRILDVADGIGLSSISDMDHRYIEKIADQVRTRGKLFSLHASERIREDIDFILSLDPAFVIHMTEAADSDILKCAESEVPIVVCARSNMYYRKTPPVKKMLAFGADIALGTDNAMMGSPDMRAEASAFRDILLSQGGTLDDVIGPMFSNGRKILYTHKKVHISVGMPADLTVLPYSGEFSMDGVLRERGKAFRYDPKRRNSIEF